MIYVALLRGINVGGNRRVDMKQLKTVFEESGMDSVRTYINSGNVVFSSRMRSKARIETKLQDAIAGHFGFDVDVLVRDLETMRAVVRKMPDEWVNDDDMKCDVLFLWSEVAKPSIVERLDHNPDVEDLTYASGAVIWRVERKHRNKSRMAKLVGTDLYKKITIRNANTTRKLLSLMEAASG